ncbi:unnamed protein product [Chrysodeixis includens]|uniref:Uncharacterized protein n=1 Tax=Chrysodeixis includens TaxID=689277 RepID=A0A9P0BKZ7_CHRIL|nr:unnamed protein product [Chrysodeixis includens]
MISSRAEINREKYLRVLKLFKLRMLCYVMFRIYLFYYLNRLWDISLVPSYSSLKKKKHHTNHRAPNKQHWRHLPPPSAQQQFELTQWPACINNARARLKS